MANLRGIPSTPIGVDNANNPIFVRPQLQFFLVVEAKNGPSTLDVATSVFNWDVSDPTVRPDLQIEPARSLGNGSIAVCDQTGGVPAIAPPSFALTQQVANVLNDFGCRFVAHSSTGEACTGDGGTSFFFVDSSSKVQFCGLMGSQLAFPPGDTLITVQVLDIAGQPGYVKSIVIRVP